MMVLRRVRRYSAMLTAVDDEITKVSSGGIMRNEGTLPRSWKRLRVTDGLERKQDGRARCNLVREVRYLWKPCHLRINSNVGLQVERRMYVGLPRSAPGCGNESNLQVIFAWSAPRKIRHILEV